MAVYHVLKDGSRPKSIAGHVVKIEDAKALYNSLDLIVKKRPKKVS